MLDPQPHKQAANTQSADTPRFALTAPGAGKPAKPKKSRLTSFHHMNEQYEILTSPEELRQACEQLNNADAIGTDCETTALDPHLGDLRLLQLSIPEQTFIIDVQKISDRDAYHPLKQVIETPGRRIISHNSKFEQKWLKAKLGIEPHTIFCSQLAHTLLDHGSSHNLETTAKRFLDISLDKTLQQSDWTREISEEQFRYAARDAQVLIPLREKMIPALIEQGLVRVAQLEFECCAVVADIELNGIHVDRKMWSDHLAIVKQQHEVVSRELQGMLAEGSRQNTLFGYSGINLNSHHEILAALVEMGVPLESATRENVLVPLQDEFPVVAKLLEYRGLQKKLSGYGDNWLQALSPITDRLYPDFSQIGAPTGRTSCSDPNVQQVPTDKEYRRCFRAPEGRSLVITDYSQIELRILAALSNDEGFVQAFKSGADLHRTTASQIFNIPIDQVTKDQRDFAKRLNFGVVYGIGAPRLANMTGMPLTDAEAMLTKYFATYRTLDKFLRATAQAAVESRSCRTMSGRLIKYSFDPNDRQAVSSVRRRGRNARIQGTGADIFKRSLRLVFEGLRETSAKIVNIIHDEIVIECDLHDANEISEIVSAQMTQAAEEYITDIPMLAEPKVCQEWVKD